MGVISSFGLKIAYCFIFHSLSYILPLWPTSFLIIPNYSVDESHFVSHTPEILWPGQVIPDVCSCTYYLLYEWKYCNLTPFKCQVLNCNPEGLSTSLILVAQRWTQKTTYTKQFPKFSLVLWPCQINSPIILYSSKIVSSTCPIHSFHANM